MSTVRMNEENYFAADIAGCEMLFYQHDKWRFGYHDLLI